MANRKPEPQLFTVKQIIEHGNNTLSSPDWTPARPLACPTFLEKIKLAWKVFKGEGDVLVWTNEVIHRPAPPEIMEEAPAPKKKIPNQSKGLEYADSVFSEVTPIINMSAEGMSSPFPYGDNRNMIFDAYMKGWNDCNEN
jgi:hypothetical protein